MNRPRQVDGQRLSALRFADSQVQSLWSALLLFPLLPRGFSNRELRQHFAPLLGQLPAQLAPGRMTYQLRRLRLHGVIQRIPQTHRYQLTDFGLRAALFSTRITTASSAPAWPRCYLPCQPGAIASVAVSINFNGRSMHALRLPKSPLET